MTSLAMARKSCYFAVLSLHPNKSWLYCNALLYLHNAWWQHGVIVVSPHTERSRVMTPLLAWQGIHGQLPSLCHILLWCRCAPWTKHMLCWKAATRSPSLRQLLLHQPHCDANKFVTTTIGNASMGYWSGNWVSLMVGTKWCKNLTWLHKRQVGLLNFGKPFGTGKTWD